MWWKIRQKMSFDKKCHSTKNVIRQKMSFDKNFNSTKILIRQKGGGYEELGTTNSRVFSTSGGKILNQLSVNKLFELASAPDEVKEDVAKATTVSLF